MVSIVPAQVLASAGNVERTSISVLYASSVTATIQFSPYTSSGSAKTRTSSRGYFCSSAVAVREGTKRGMASTNARLSLPAQGGRHCRNLSR